MIRLLLLPCLLLAASVAAQINLPNCHVDLMLVLDTSGNDAEELRQAQDTIVKAYDQIPRQFLRVGIISFNENATLVQSLGDPTQTPERTRHHILQMAQTGGGTSAMRAMQLAMLDLKEHRRPHAQLAIVLASDGNSGATDTFNKVRATAKQLHEIARGATILALTYNPKYYRSELRIYTGNDENVFATGDQDKFPDALTSATRRDCAVQTLFDPIIPIVSSEDACNVDIMVLMDNTKQRTPKEKELDRSIALSAVKYFKVDDFGTVARPVRVRVGLVMLDNSGIHLVHSLGAYASKREIIDKIIGLNMENSANTLVEGKSLADALSYVQLQLQQFATPTPARMAVVYIGDANSQHNSYGDLWSAGRFLRNIGDVTVFGVNMKNDYNQNNMKAIVGISKRIYTTTDYHTSTFYRNITDFTQDFYAYANDDQHCQPAYTSNAFCDIDMLIVQQSNGIAQTDFIDNAEMLVQLIDSISDQDYESDRINVAVMSTNNVIHSPFALWKRKKDLISAIESIQYNGWFPSPSIRNITEAAIKEVLRGRRKHTLLLVLFAGNGKYDRESYQELRDISNIWTRMPNAYVVAMTPSSDAYAPGLAALTGRAERVYVDQRAKTNFVSDLLANVLNLPDCIDSRPRVVAGGVRKRNS